MTDNWDVLNWIEFYFVFVPVMMTWGKSIDSFRNNTMTSKEKKRFLGLIGFSVVSILVKVL